MVQNCSQAVAEINSYCMLCDKYASSMCTLLAWASEEKGTSVTHIPGEYIRGRGMTRFFIAADVYFVSYPEVVYSITLAADSKNFLAAVAKMASYENMIEYARVVSLQNSAYTKGSAYRGFFRFAFGIMTALNSTLQDFFTQNTESFYTKMGMLWVKRERDELIEMFRREMDRHPNPSELGRLLDNQITYYRQNPNQMDMTVNAYDHGSGPEKLAAT